MNRSLTLASFLSALLLIVNPVYAQTKLKPADVMDKVNNADMGDNVESRMVMTITNEKGEKKETELVSYRKNFKGIDGETRNIMFYTGPKTLKGVGFLSFDYKNPKKPDDRWFYSPAIKKVKHVSSSDQRLAFMNSDFSYADMTVRDSENYIFFNAMKETTIDGQKVWIIEGTPIHENDVGDAGYSKSTFYVRQDNFILVRAVNVLKNGGKEKQMDISQLKQVDGYWVMGQIKMTTRKAGKELSSTTLVTKEAKFNQTFSDTFFTEEQLPLGLN